VSARRNTLDPPETFKTCPKAKINTLLPPKHTNLRGNLVREVAKWYGKDSTIAKLNNGVCINDYKRAEYFNEPGVIRAFPASCNQAEEESAGEK
jgi:hypothetical protein